MITIRANYDQSRDMIKFYGTEGTGREIYELVTSVGSKHEAYTELPCFLELSRSEAQDLFDSMYACGLRPPVEQKAENTENNSHLEDMRKIVFALLKVPDGQ